MIIINKVSSIFIVAETIFAARRYASAVCIVALCLPARSSVRLTQVGVLPKWLKTGL